jgi:ubiquinone/menaquinone biosynthesis C-methylase UbiE
VSRKGKQKMAESHVFNPKHIAALESEERKTWQNPEEIIKLLPLKPSYVVADLGCGTGYFTLPISRKAKKVYGIDIQKEMLTVLEQKIRKQKIRNIQILLSNENEIPLQNASVDLLLSVNTLHEFSDKDAIISEMWRVLRADGNVAIIDFKKEDTGFGPPVSIRLSKEQAKRLFQKNGLTALKMHDLKYHYLIVFGKTGAERSFEGAR